MQPEPLLAIENLSISFFTRAGGDPGGDELLRLRRGRARRSGSWASRAAASRRWRSAVMRDLGKTGRIVGGSIRFKGRELTTMSDAELRQIRGSEIAMIYQEPMASLNPAMKVGRQLMEVPMIHAGAERGGRRARRRCAWWRRCGCPTRSASSAATRTSSPAASSSASSSPWR